MKYANETQLQRTVCINMAQVVLHRIVFSVHKYISVKGIIDLEVLKK